MIRSECAMPVSPAAQPEPARPSGPDLALVEALQRDPRAPWTRIAAAVGTDATTAPPRPGAAGARGARGRAPRGAAPPPPLGSAAGGRAGLADRVRNSADHDRRLRR